jgi:hypothetical protein
VNTNIILLKALLEPEYSRIEFWKQKQKESSFSEIVFWKKLNNSLDFYFDKINYEIERRNEMFLKAGKEPQYLNFGLSLFNETNGELNADFTLDNSILIELRNKLLEWAEEIKPIIYYYNYTPKNVIIANYSLLKHFEFLKNLNIVSFNYELRNKPVEQINEFLDFHLRNFKRQYEKLSNWNELLAEWFSYTKKQMPATFTPHQKDNFLSWFESHNTFTIELQNETVDEPNENDFLKSTIDEYLEPFKKNMNEGDYNILVSAIKQHIETGSFPKLKKEIKITGKPNQKKFGWAINRIYCAKNMGVEKALLIFAHQKISLFKNTEFNEKDFLNSNLYKYFTTKTQ